MCLFRTALRCAGLYFSAMVAVVDAIADGLCALGAGVDDLRRRRQPGGGA